MKHSKRLILIIFTLLIAAAPVSSLPAAGNSADSRSGSTEQGIAFNFVNVEIPTVIKFISEITGYNFLFDDRIKGQITIIAPTKLTIDESFNLFTSVLSIKGYTIIPSGKNTYKIIPSSLAKQSGSITEDGPAAVNEGYITKLITVENIRAEEALQFLRPVISRDGHISAFGPRNMLLAVDSAVNIEKIISILRLIDQPGAEKEEATIHVYFLEHADATDLSKVLQGIIKDLQTSYKTAQRKKKDAGGQSIPILSVTPDKSTNSLVIVAPYTDYKNIEAVISTLDRKRKQVYVEAMIVEASVDKLKDIGTKWRATVSHNDEPIVVGGVGKVDTDTFIDILTGLAGLSGGGMGNFLDIPLSIVDSSGTVSNQTLTAPGFAALFSLSVFEDAINILSTPQILTSDNEEAEIVVGENVPFIGQRERDVVTTNTVVNSIERTDVGIKLKITPQITEGDYVKLELFQEISAVKNTSDIILVTIGPTTTKRSTKTTVVVKDGSTVVIGGLMQEIEEVNVSKVPILGDIPYLEWLFKFKSVSRDKQNLLVFLSPHIVKEELQLTEITEEKHQEFTEKEKFYYKTELLVKFRDGVTDEQARAIIAQNKSSVIKHFRAINVYHVHLKPEQDVEEAIAIYTSIPEVQYAEPNYKLKIRLPDEKAEPDSDTLYRDPGLESPAGRTAEETSDHSVSVYMPSPSVQVINPPDNADNPEPVKLESITSEPLVRFRDEPLHDIDIHEPEQHAAETLPQTEPEQARSTGTHAEEVPEPVADSVPAEEDVLSSPPDQEKAPMPSVLPDDVAVVKPRKHYIQLGAWVNSEYALETWNRLRKDYRDIYIVREGKFNIVRIPGTANRKNDASIMYKLRKRYRLKPILVNETI